MAVRSIGMLLITLIGSLSWNTDQPAVTSMWLFNSLQEFLYSNAFGLEDANILVTTDMLSHAVDSAFSIKRPPQWESLPVPNLADRRPAKWFRRTGSKAHSISNNGNLVEAAYNTGVLFFRHTQKVSHRGTSNACLELSLKIL